MTDEEFCHEDGFVVMAHSIFNPTMLPVGTFYSKKTAENRIEYLKDLNPNFCTNMNFTITPTWIFKDVD